ncbi:MULTISPECIES: helix-turn-helix domain-containing protein [Acinetobacter]|uniref:Winged helix-turn-helix domain-containing protein n=1 Tax=Acinetobacter corruptisaponis TaxID=3045147 RepID=A0ABY8S7C0_9GAMM|nr:winged helix-turn-helix domain-containing protein [Acinetobacter sp. KCTC 92772]WHP04535.1 winged helix-turn-helix domain-containing protein [Acinetobacter sp. KCTC 92772]WHP06128.1 winged helix-turn-helix domain-containing protein [Acinetobacter sp. KCTC 92772]WHP07321.1 winged helix-turn-helix domain-containing protein [Acinetobacter sp. KCTC 92772]
MKNQQIQHDLSAYNFGELSTREKDPRARTRLLILHQYSIGKSTPEISESMYISEHTVMKTRRKYWKYGLSSIYDQPRSGRKPKLAKQDIDTFKTLIVKEQEDKERGSLVCDDIVELAKEHFKVDYSRNGMYHVLKRIGMSWISARSQHPQADIAKQEDF